MRVGPVRSGLIPAGMAALTLTGCGPWLAAVGAGGGAAGGDGGGAGGDATQADGPRGGIGGGEGVPPAPASAARSTASASPTTVVANGTARSTVTVKVMDRDGAPLAGCTVRLSSSGSANDVAQPAFPTGTDGEVTGSLATTRAESKTITITVDPDSAPVVLSTRPSITFTAGAAARLAFSVQPSAAAVDERIAPAIELTALDAFGNVASGFHGRVTVALAANTSGARLSGDRTRDADDGVARFGDLRVDEPGTYQLTATAGGLAPATSDAFAIGLGDASWTESLAVVAPAPIGCERGPRRERGCHGRLRRLLER